MCGVFLRQPSRLPFIGLALLVRGARRGVGERVLPLDDMAWPVAQDQDSDAQAQRLL